MTTIQTEPMVPAIPEIKQLIGLHWIEVAGYKDQIPLDPDWDRYAELEAAGNIWMATAREEGRMVGYSIFFVGPMLHYKSTVLASNDVVFLHPLHRKGRTTGMRLIKYSHEEMRKRAQRIVWHLKVAHDWGAILKRLGYKHEENLMGMYVGV